MFYLSESCYFYVVNNKYMNKERTIELAYDKDYNGKLFDVKKEFSDYKKAIKAWKYFSNTNPSIEEQCEINELFPNCNLKTLYCSECGQPLDLYKNNKNTVFLRHHNNSQYCILKDGNMNETENELFRCFHISKETEEHKRIKTSIGYKLQQTPGVSEVHIDDRFLFSEYEKRKPDVFCIYNGQKYVFEIQLSDISMRLIKDRTDFYENEGIGLIWILNQKNIFCMKNGLTQTSMAKNIKYLNPYQNFFEYSEDDNINSLLIGHFKSVFIIEDEIKKKWREKTVSFGNNLFIDDKFNVYCYDYPSNKRLKEIEISNKKNKDKIREIVDGIQNIKYESEKESLLRKINSLEDNQKILFADEIDPYIEKILSTENRKELLGYKFAIDILVSLVSLGIVTGKGEKLNMLLDKIEVYTIINEIEELKQCDKLRSYSDLNDSYRIISGKIANFSENKIKLLNAILKSREPSAIQEWIKKTQNPIILTVFLVFILSCKEIDIRLDEVSSKRIIHELLFENNKLHNLCSDKEKILILLSARKMKISSDDYQNIESEFGRYYHIIFFCMEMAGRLSNLRYATDLLDNHKKYPNYKLLAIIESIKQKRMITFGYKDDGKWKQLANYAMLNYSQYWNVIEAAFKKYGLWEDVSKSNLLKKKNMEPDIESNDRSADKLIEDLYHDLL